MLMVISMYQLLPFVNSGFGDKFMSNDANDISIASNMQGSISRG